MYEGDVQNSPSCGLFAPDVEFYTKKIEHIKTAVDGHHEAYRRNVAKADQLSTDDAKAVARTLETPLNGFEAATNEFWQAIGKHLMTFTGRT